MVATVRSRGWHFTEIQSTGTLAFEVSLIGVRENHRKAETLERRTMLFFRFSKNRLTEDLNSISGADNGCGEVVDEVYLREKQSMLEKKYKIRKQNLRTTFEKDKRKREIKQRILNLAKRSRFIVWRMWVCIAKRNRSAPLVRTRSLSGCNITHWWQTWTMAKRSSRMVTVWKVSYLHYQFANRCINKETMYCIPMRTIKPSKEEESWHTSFQSTDPPSPSHTRLNGV